MCLYISNKANFIAFNRPIMIDQRVAGKEVVSEGDRRWWAAETATMLLERSEEVFRDRITVTLK